MHKARPLKYKLPFWKKTIFALFGIIFSIAFLEISLRLGGFIFSSLQEYRNRTAIYKKGTYRIMCLGESTTAMGGEDSYPSQLEDILNQCNTGITFSVINKGVPIINTSYIIEHLNENLNKYQPDMVVAMIGNNDSYVKYYQDISDSGTALLNKLKAYKFLRMIWMNIMNKISRKALTVSRLDRENIKSGVMLSTVQFKKGYTEQSNDNPNEKSLRRSSEINPKDDNAYIESGFFYRNQGEDNKAEEFFKKAVELDPGSFRAYLELGNIYMGQIKYIQSEETLKKAIELNPQDVRGYLALSQVYHVQGKIENSKNILKKAIEINPENDMVYIELGLDYKMSDEYAQAEDYFKEAVALNPSNFIAYYHLGNIYMYEQRFMLAEEMFKKAIPQDREGKAYSNLILLYEIQGKNEAAEECANKLKILRQEYENPITRNNYLKLKTILDKRDIKLVCVQYPVLSIEPLRRIFNDKEGVIFVDNEKIFKDALKKASLKEYFIDMFAGEFGHCTRKGNRLLAGNIADAILKERFNR